MSEERTQFSQRSITLLQAVLVSGYSFGNILRSFKLPGIPYEYFKEFDVPERVSKSVLVRTTIERMDALPSPERNGLLLVLLEDILIAHPYGPQYEDNEAYQMALSRLEKSLEIDGFKIENRKIVRISDEDILEEHNILLSSLKEFGFKVTIHHLELSRTHFIDSKWDSANGQTRKALEELTKKIAEIIAERGGEDIPMGRRAKSPRPVDIREYLKKCDFLDNNEWELLRAFYGYASDKGAHPGLSNETESRLRRFMLIGLCQFYIEKLRTYLAS